jgi:hypothetical protein
MGYGVGLMRASGRLILVSLGILCLDIDGVREALSSREIIRCLAFGF